MAFFHKFTAESEASESIPKFGSHLAKLWEKV